VVREINPFLPEGLPIKLFAIARMRNSPATTTTGLKINAVVPIKRDHYSKNDCPLCELGQPLKEVQTVDDFYYIDKAQLTPFDFWELVKDCNALERLQLDPQERKFLYRINTKRIIARYRNWLKSVIRQKYESVWPNTRPTAICTVEEKRGIEFSGLVAESLDVGMDNVISIQRDILRRITPSSVLLNGENPFSEKSQRILIVDDGINYGFTIENLINYCRAGGFNPAGALVLDSRLTEEQQERLQALMGGQRILALYNWPSPALY
jgi:adenine/guanine phosphoribosyltransferase-like PRPP-binding protein